MATYHPALDEHGQPVLLKCPSQATPISNWSDPRSVATVTPGGELPAILNGIPLTDWAEVPTSIDTWNAVDGQCDIDEPPFSVPRGKAPASGVLIKEADGRFWLVSPSNAFGGYTNTFPKGRIDDDMKRQASAIREAYEESGLKVRITGFLADSVRSQSYTRYYLAERVGGNPASMGWETQAVHLVPRHALSKFLTHPNDQPLLQSILALAR